jgi:hypothetical protein
LALNSSFAHPEVAFFLNFHYRKHMQDFAMQDPGYEKGIKPKF